MTISIPTAVELVSTNITDGTPFFDNTVRQNFPIGSKLQFEDDIYMNSSEVNVPLYDGGVTYAVGDLAFKDDLIKRFQLGSGEVPKNPEEYTSFDTSPNHTYWANRYVKLGNVWTGYPSTPYTINTVVGADTITSTIEKNSNNIWEWTTTATIPNTEVIATGDITPASAVSTGSGNISWTNPLNSLIEDSVWTTANFTVDDQLSKVLLTAFDLDSVPDTAEITGIEFSFLKSQMESSAFPPKITTHDIYIYNNGVRIGNNKKPSPNEMWYAASSWTVVGGATDTWGLTLTGADLKNNFGVGVQCFFNNNDDMSTRVGRVDVTKIKIYYKPTTTQTVIATSTPAVITEILPNTLEVNAELVSSSVHPDYAHKLNTIIVRPDGVYARTNQSMPQDYKEVTGNFFATVESPENMNFIFLEKANQHKPFDGKNYSVATSDTGTITYTIQNTVGFNALALANVIGTNVKIVFKNAIGNILLIIDKAIDTTLLDTGIDFGKTVVYYCNGAYKADITISGSQIGSIVPAKYQDLGANDLKLKHEIADFSTFEFDEWGNANYVPRPTVIKYSGTVNIELTNYSQILRFFKYINKTEVIIDGDDSNNRNIDEQYISESTILIGRFMTNSQESLIKDGDIDQNAQYSFTVQEIV